MKNSIITKTAEPCTACHDVIELLSFEGQYKKKYTLYKTLKVGIDRNAFGWVYFLIMQNDKFPLVITEECAEQILNGPQKGEELVFNRWFDRYK